MAKPRQYPFQRAIKALLPQGAARRLDRRIKLALCDAVVISYPKSGRTWLRAMLSFYFARLYGTPKDLPIDFANLHNLDRRVPRLYFSHEADYKGPPERIRIDRRRLRNKKLVFLARDPRDVIVSLYAHRVHRSRNWEGPIDSFVTGAEGGLATALRYFHDWNGFLAEHGAALVLRYEDLHADPAAGLAALLHHLGQPVDAEAIRAAVEETRFARLQKMESEALFRSTRLAARDAGNPEAFKVRRGRIGGFAEDLDPETAREIGTTMDDELQGAFGYRAAPSEDDVNVAKN
jgi:alcohol sulfotransferase